METILKLFHNETLKTRHIQRIIFGFIEILVIIQKGIVEKVLFICEGFRAYHSVFVCRQYVF